MPVPTLESVYFLSLGLILSSLCGASLFFMFVRVFYIAALKFCHCFKRRPANLFRKFLSCLQSVRISEVQKCELVLMDSIKFVLRSDYTFVFYHCAVWKWKRTRLGGFRFSSSQLHHRIVFVLTVESYHRRWILLIVCCYLQCRLLWKCEHSCLLRRTLLE